jgi:uncharacterized membrane protein YtjA (UPF0391 family)
MTKFSKLFLVVSVVAFIAGFGDVGGSIVSGLARAMGAVFFILFFITRLFEAVSAEQ